jgi:predicted aconitase with swiveling domain
MCSRRTPRRSLEGYNLMAERVMQAKVYVAGQATGEVLRLSEPLSLWGGLNPETGEITDRHHPASGQNVTAKILVMPSGRGSSSASSILLEAVRLNNAPAAIILAQMDGILVLGAVVASEIYGVDLPVLVANQDDYEQLQSGTTISISHDGQLSIY